MSQFLTGLAQLNPQVKRHNGGTSTLTLDQNGTTNATLLFINGVAQSPGTDFNVSGATLTTTSALPAGTNIATTIQYFNTGIVSAPADNSVTGAKLDVSLVQGDVLTATGTDTLARLAKGTANQKLSMNSAANAVEWQTVASSGWTFVSSVTASSSANVSFTTMAAGYDYMVTFTDLLPATDSVDLDGFLGVAGPTYRTSDYDGHTGIINTGSGGGSSLEWSGLSAMKLTADNQGNAADEHAVGNLTIYDPFASTDTYVIGDIAYHGSGTSHYNGVMGGKHETAESITSIKFSYSSGNIATGIFKLYKRANA